MAQFKDFFFARDGWADLCLFFAIKEEDIFITAVGEVLTLVERDGGIDLFSSFFNNEHLIEKESAEFRLISI